MLHPTVLGKRPWYLDLVTTLQQGSCTSELCGGWKVKMGLTAEPKHFFGTSQPRSVGD